MEDNKWIPASELPKMVDKYLCFTTLGCTELCWFEDGEWSGDLRGDEQVTHWQPISDPPTTQEGDKK